MKTFTNTLFIICAVIWVGIMLAAALHLLYDELIKKPKHHKKMKTLAMVGDPGTIAVTLNRIYACNPDLEVVSTCVGPWFVTTEAPKVARLGQPPQQQMQQLNAFYLTWDNCEVLLDENGKPLQF
jgi:hypothetical protein